MDIVEDDQLEKAQEAAKALGRKSIKKTKTSNGDPLAELDMDNYDDDDNGKLD